MSKFIFKAISGIGIIISNVQSLKLSSKSHKNIQVSET